jgi:preprotein translocase SecE subunit
MDSTKIKAEANNALAKVAQTKDAMTDGDEAENTEEPKQPSRPSPGHSPGPVSAPIETPGYFTIYKKGQGYWTRMGTVAAAALIGLLTGNFIYTELEGRLSGQNITKFLTSIHLQQPRAGYLVVAIFAALYSIIAFHYMNKPGSVDFLIATDSEMKKVNWTTRKELMGSTKVVIGFMFVMATVLFLYDIFFQLVFYLLGVLRTPPFFLGH